MGALDDPTRRGDASPPEPRGDAPLPEPPWWAARRPARATLSREAIVETAIALLDREGIARFSMRRLADALGTGAASLYWHVSGKGQLFEMIVDRLVERAGPPELAGERWTDQVRDWAHKTRAVMHEHPWLTAPDADIFPTGPNVMAQSEMLLGALRSGGLPDRVAAVAVHLLPLFVAAFVRDEVSGLAGHDEAPEQVIAQITSWFASLPPERFPNFTAIGPQVVEVDWDERFDVGLDVFVGGLAALTQR
jgi:AcrR family transcriptional regulator